MLTDARLRRPSATTSPPSAGPGVRRESSGRAVRCRAGPPACDQRGLGVTRYLASLDGPKGEDERQRLLDAVTVQETHFFRNPPQMEALRRRGAARAAAPLGRPGPAADDLERRLLDGRGALHAGDADARALADARHRRPQARIVGTDVSARGAATRRAAATYTGRALETAPPMLRDRWFEPTAGGALGGARRGRAGWSTLRLHNLVTEPPPFGARRGRPDRLPQRHDLLRPRDDPRLVGRLPRRAGRGRLPAARPLRDAVAGERRVHAGAGRRRVRLPPSHDARRGRPRAPPVPVRDPLRRRRRRSRAAGAARPAPRCRPAPRRTVTVALRAGTPTAARRARLSSPAASTRRPPARPRRVRADPLLAPAYVVLGQARSTLGQDGAAVDPLRKAVYLDPTAGHAHFLLGGALSRLGQHGGGRGLLPRGCRVAAAPVTTPGSPRPAGRARHAGAG